MTEYETKDSGQHQEYDSGMRRDSQDGKPRFDLIRTKRQSYDEQMITRYAELLRRGAEKYDARNWEEGDSEEELDRAKSSLLRHTEQLIAGETDEDHAAAVWFNAQAIEYFRWRLARKKRNGSAKRRRKARAKAETAKPESEINQLALQKAAKMRSRERMRAAPEEFDRDGVKKAERDAVDPIIDVNADGTAIRRSHMLRNQESGAQGLFQFENAPWPRPPMPVLPTHADLLGKISKLYRVPVYHTFVNDYAVAKTTSTEVDQTHPYE